MSTKAELQEQLDELGIEYDPSSTKAVLQAMIEHPSTPAARGSNTQSNTDRPIWEGGESRSEYHARLRAWKLEQRR